MAAAKGTLIFIPVGGLLLAGCTTLAPTEDPVYLKLTDIEARLIRVERVIDNQSLIELATQVDQLQSQTQALRGEIETLRFETESASNRQRDLYVDVDQRMQALESRPTPRVLPESAPFTQAPPVSVEGASPAGDGTLALEPDPALALPLPAGNDQDNYQAAFDLLKDGRYPDSASAFAQFLTVFPNSPLADNAQYWLAETHYVQRDFSTALPAFEEVVNTYPDSAKIPDALLKIGFCNYELQRWEQARSALEQVAREFPQTTAARLAAQRLERMGQERG